MRRIPVSLRGRSRASADKLSVPHSQSVHHDCSTAERGQFGALPGRSIPNPGVVARQSTVAHRLISLSTCSLLPPAFDMFPVFLVIYSGPALSRCCRSRLLSVRCGRPIREIVDILITAQFIPRYCILLIMASQAHRVSIAETDVASFVTLLHDRS